MSTEALRASVDTKTSGAVSVPRLTRRAQVVVEDIVGNLRAAHLARFNVESVVNATPDAAVRLVIAEVKEARVRLCVHDRVAGGVPRRREDLRIASQHVRKHARGTAADAGHVAG